MSLLYVRVGSCRNCGECCKILDGINNLPRRCPAYVENGHGSHCRIYEKLPEVCRVSPKTPRDVFVVPKCGFQFVDSQTGKVVDSYMLQSTQKHLRLAQKRRVFS